MRRSIPPLCIAVVALVVAVQSMQRGAETTQHGRAWTPPAAPCSDAQRAVLGGLDIDQNLGDFRVIGFRCAQPKVVEIDLRKEAIPLVLIVAEPGAVPHSSPRQTNHHDLFYNRQTADNEPPTQQDIDALLVLLAKQVEAAER